jgi:hypothetical protein
LAGDGAAHEVSGRHDLELAIEKAYLGFVLEAEELFDAVHSKSFNDGAGKADAASLVCAQGREIANSRRFVKGRRVD